MINRLILMFLVLTAAMQATLIYRSYRKSPPPTGTSIRDAPQSAFMDLKGMQTRGAPGSRIVLIEFSDYECPYCSRHANSVGRTIQKQYVDSGQVQYVFANNPLPMHSNARWLAVAAICAGSQELYWDMHDLLFESVPKTQGQMLEAISGLGLDSEEFNTCRERNTSAENQIDRDIAKAKQLGLTGTPAFALGTIVSPGRAKIQKLIVGAQPERVFADAIAALRAQP
jgi:protein-disulfide isomerase